MSVIDVYEDYSQRQAAQTLRKDFIELTAQRVYTVKFDGTDNPVAEPLIALNAQGPSDSVPPYGSWHPSVSFLALIDKQVKVFGGPKNYEVTCKYSNDPYQTSFAQDPMERKPEVNWLFNMTNEKIDTDINGDPIMNASDESFDPPVQEDVYDLILRVVRNEQSYDALLAWEYIGALNEDTFCGFDPGMARCTTFSGEKVYNDQYGFYFKVTYEFIFRWDGWKKRILDEGFRTKQTQNQGEDEGEIVYEEILDDNGKRITQPRHLYSYVDNYGNQVSTTTSDSFWLEFETIRKVPFSVLNIENSLNT